MKRYLKCAKKDYFTHAISGQYPTFLNHYFNSEPVRQDSYVYSTFDWGRYARKVLIEDPELPKFIYLAFNAPHEKTAAPKDLRQRFQRIYPDMPFTRTE